MSPEQERISTQELLEQRRARFAHDAVAEIRKTEKEKEDYATLAQDLPASILQNGLGQTVAFLMSKAEGKEKSSHGLLLRQLATWLIDKVKGRGILPDPGNSTPLTERLMDALLYEQGGTRTTRSQWRRAEQEALELAIWLKRFAEALIEKPKSTGEERDDEGASAKEAEA
jgi:CRISPR-associated protein Cmr5